MAKFIVNVTETNHGFVGVDAGCEKEACDKAEDSYFDGNAIWSSAELTTLAVKAAGNPFAGRTVAVTGKLGNFTRNSINKKIESLGGKAGCGVSRNTDYLICGLRAGSKLEKARKLGVTILSEQQFLLMAESA